MIPSPLEILCDLTKEPLAYAGPSKSLRMSQRLHDLVGTSVVALRTRINPSSIGTPTGSRRQRELKALVYEPACQFGAPEFRIGLNITECAVEGVTHIPDADLGFSANSAG